MYNNFGPVASTQTISSTLLMMFSAGMRDPAVVIKLCKEVMVVKREFENLHAVQDRVRDLSPTPLFFDTIDSFGVLAMKAVPGRYISTWNERVDRLPALVDRLISFHRSVQLGYMDQDQSLRCFREPFETIGKLGRDSKVEAACARMGEVLSHALKGTSLPRILQHGDFCFNNILIQGDHVSVVDWEDFGEVSLPGYDLVSLFLNFYTLGDPQQLERFFEDNRFVGYMRNGIEAYFKAFDLPLNLAHGIFAFTLMQRFLHSHQLVRSSTEMFWHQVSAYVQHPERFSRLLEG